MTKPHVSHPAQSGAESVTRFDPLWTRIRLDAQTAANALMTGEIDTGEMVSADDV